MSARSSNAAPKPAPAPRPPVAPVDPADPKKLHDLTERIAFELYEKRGCSDGNDQSDWFTAEKIARERIAAGKA